MKYINFLCGFSVVSWVLRQSLKDGKGKWLQVRNACLVPIKECQLKQKNHYDLFKGDEEPQGQSTGLAREMLWTLTDPSIPWQNLVKIH